MSPYPDVEVTRAGKLPTWDSPATDITSGEHGSWDPWQSLFGWVYEMCGKTDPWNAW